MADDKGAENAPAAEGAAKTARARDAESATSGWLARAETRGVESERSSEAEWLAAAMDEHQSRLIHYTVQLVGDEDTARDIVQDAFVALHTADRSRVQGHLGQWLYTVCRNRAVDVLRKESRVVQRFESVAEANPEAALSPGAIAEAHDVCERVCAIIDTLPPNQQEVMRLKFEGELSYREISGVTGLSVSNVGYLLHIAIKTIRQHLQVEADTVLGA